jgi:hypothetical protein
VWSTIMQYLSDDAEANSGTASIELTVLNRVTEQLPWRQDLNCQFVDWFCCSRIH